MDKLLLFPYNGNAMEAIGCVNNKYEIVGFIDDNPEKQGIIVHGLEIFSREALEIYKEAKVLAVPGSSESFKQRKDLINSLKIPIKRFATIIHSNATVSPLAKIGRNVLLMAGVIITSNATIGDNVCILPNSVIHHDTFIGDWTLIGSNVLIAGNTKIEENCYIGSGSNIINNVTIGKSTLIGLGTNIIKNIPENSKVVGNPPRFLN